MSEETAQAIAESVRTDSFPQLHTGHTPVQTKVKAAAAYILNGGNAKAAAHDAGVHHNSVLTWKQEEWWPYLLEKLNQDFQEDLKYQLRQAAGKAVNVIEDRLENGDKVLNYKTGEMEYRPISGKDAATIFGILNDKYRVMDNKPTSISENKSQDQRMNELLERFEEFARYQKTRTIEHGEQKQ